MARVSTRIPRAYRLFLYALLLTSWSSGSTFFVLNKWVTVEGEFGPEKHPMQVVALRTHGGAAFLMMVCYGFLLASHVPAGWRSKRMRRLGLTLVSAQGFLILSAYLLYYLANDGFRILLSYAHASVGFLFPFLLAAHLYSAARDRNVSLATKATQRSFRDPRSHPPAHASDGSPRPGVGRDGRGRARRW